MCNKCGTGFSNDCHAFHILLPLLHDLIDFDYISMMKQLVTLELQMLLLMLLQMLLPMLLPMLPINENVNYVLFFILVLFCFIFVSFILKSYLKNNDGKVKSE